MSPDSHGRALDGIVVLDLTRLLPGAVATHRLAAQSAEVIKIEEPGAGDYARRMPPLIDGVGAVFLRTNAGKKSVALNLKDPRGREALLRLAAIADVLVEGFRPGVMDRLGLGCETLRARNPHLVYASLTGYGSDGPRSAWAGHDVNYLATAGVLDLIGSAGGPPVIPGVQIADIAGGSLQLVIGILLALLDRRRTGQGCRVDVSMTDGLADMLEVPMSRLQATGLLPERGKDVLSGRYACYNVYRARDGRWLAVGALEARFWENLCRALGCEDLIADQFAEGRRRVELIERVAAIFAGRDALEWSALLEDRDCCVTPVQTIGEYSPAPSHRAAAPILGEHTREVLRRAGLTEPEIDDLAPEALRLH